MTGYHVEVRVGLRDDLTLPTDDQLDNLLTALGETGDVGATVGRDGHSYSVALTAPVDNEGDALAFAHDTVLKTAAGVGLPTGPDVWLTVGPAWMLERDVDQPTVPRLLGLTEVAAFLGVSRQRAGQLRERLPQPMAELAAGPVWTEPQITAWAEGWTRKPGRPRAELVDDVAQLQADVRLAVKRARAGLLPPVDSARTAPVD